MPTRREPLSTCESCEVLGTTGGADAGEVAFDVGRATLWRAALDLRAAAVDVAVGATGAPVGAGADPVSPSARLRITGVERGIRERR